MTIWWRTQIFSVELTEICVRNYLLACEKLGLTKSKMASVEEIRTRISLREHDVINVSWTSFYALKIEYIILQTVPDNCFFSSDAQHRFPRKLHWLWRHVEPRKFWTSKRTRARNLFCKLSCGSLVFFIAILDFVFVSSSFRIAEISNWHRPVGQNRNGVWHGWCRRFHC